MSDRQSISIENLYALKGNFTNQVKQINRIMGQKKPLSRRMQKQGIPQSLDEVKPAQKRKYGPSEEKSFRAKKQKIGGEKGIIPATKNVNGKSKNSAGQSTTNGKFTSQGTKSRVSLQSHAASDDDIEDEDLDGEGIDDSDLANGEMDALGTDEESIMDDEDVIDSDDPDVQRAMWSDDEDASDAEQILTAANIEGLSRKLDTDAAQVDEEAQAELEDAALQTNIAADLGDDAKARQLAPDLQMIRSRMTETTRVLMSFSTLVEEGKSRVEYTNQLLEDICTYYGYSHFLAEKLWHLFSPQEALAFFDANETPRPLVIRTNTLRTHRRELAHSLINRGVTLEPVGKWSKVGLQVFESQVPLGATPEYLAGHYILQAASSFLPVMALAPQEGERCLDMAAAPGGKTTHMAALMRNTGCVFANDSNKDRAKALIGNIHRLGVKNTIVSNYSALEFPRVIGGFDRVLLDAPCSGTGVIAKDASVKTNKTEADFMKLPHLQKQMLLAAVDSVDHSSKTGGYIVYSTCSVTVEENEQVVQYVLNTRPNVKLVDTGLIFGKEGFTNYRGKKFHPTMNFTRRYYPHAYNVDGFFVAKFKKTGPTPPNAVRAQGQAQTKNGSSQQTNGHKVDVHVDRAPIHNDEKDDEEDADGEFGGFDDEEDAKYLERSKNNNLKRKGINPKALSKKKLAEKMEKST